MFRNKKKYGQNFIKDQNLIKKMVDLVEIKDNSLILEVGPGKGILTKELVKHGEVLSYEIDSELEEFLSEYNIIYDDFLNRDISKDIKNYKYDNLYFISNVPYYITTKILTKLIDSNLEFEKIVMMVQKEVGDRFVAKPSTKDYGYLTVLINYYFNTKKVMKVSRKEFYPEPNVDSVVIEFSKKDKDLIVKDEQIFKKLIQDSFKFKRKKLSNNLKEYNLEKIEEVLKKHNKDLNVRAEELEYKVFVEIANNLI